MSTDDVAELSRQFDRLGARMSALEAVRDDMPEIVREIVIQALKDVLPDMLKARDANRKRDRSAAHWDNLVGYGRYLLIASIGAFVLGMVGTMVIFVRGWLL